MTVKQYHINYDIFDDEYYFILPDNTEKKIYINQVEDIDFNLVYIELYKLMLSNKKKYLKIKEYNVEKMIRELDKGD